MAVAPRSRPAVDDRALLARSAAGDREAFADLVAHWERRFYGVAHRMLGERRDAEDAVQRAFLHVFLKARTYRDDRPASSWLWRVVTNVCVDALRKRRLEPVADDATDRAAAPARDVERLDLAAAVARLPVEARAILVLRYAEDLPYEEIARVRGISVNTVKTQLRRATLALRRRLKEEP
jgi:RNA polymerase sigma-70 factor (ECF subfamily)